MATTDSDHYPERLGRLVVINAPTMLAMAWKIIQTFLDDVTKAKISILSNPKDWKPLLLEYIDEDQIPQQYGGTAKDPTPDEAISNMDPPNHNADDFDDENEEAEEINNRQKNTAIAIHGKNYEQENQLRAIRLEKEARFGRSEEGSCDTQSYKSSTFTTSCSLSTSYSSPLPSATKVNNRITTAKKTTASPLLNPLLIAFLVMLSLISMLLCSDKLHLNISLETKQRLSFFAATSLLSLCIVL